MGSAEHYKVKKVQDAVKLFGSKFPSIDYEGEIQFDAAVSKKIERNKLTNSILNGNAKMTERHKSKSSDVRLLNRLVRHSGIWFANEGITPE